MGYSTYSEIRITFQGGKRLTRELIREVGDVHLSIYAVRSQIDEEGKPYYTFYHGVIGYEHSDFPRGAYTLEQSLSEKLQKTVYVIPRRSIELPHLITYMLCKSEIKNI